MDQFGTGSKAIRSRVQETRAVCSHLTSWTQGHQRKKGKKRGGGIRESLDRCSPVLLPNFMAPNSAKLVAGYLPSQLHTQSECINKLTDKPSHIQWFVSYLMRFVAGWFLWNRLYLSGSSCTYDPLSTFFFVLRKLYTGDSQYLVL